MLASRHPSPTTPLDQKPRPPQARSIELALEFLHVPQFPALELKTDKPIRAHVYSHKITARTRGKHLAISPVFKDFAQQATLVCVKAPCRPLHNTSGWSNPPTAPRAKSGQQSRVRPHPTAPGIVYPTEPKNPVETSLATD